MNEDIFKYFLEIEEFFCAQKNAPLLLSPIDYEKVAEWYSLNIPLEVVKRGIEKYFEKLSKRKIPLRKAICLSFAEDMILKALEEYRIAKIGESAGAFVEADESKRKKEFFAYIKENLEKFLCEKEKFKEYEKTRSFIETIINIIDDLNSNEKIKLSDIESKLNPLERELSRLLVSETKNEYLLKFSEEAKEVLEKTKTIYSPEIAKAIESKVVINKIYSMLKLPRLSILYFND